MKTERIRRLITQATDTLAAELEAGRSEQLQSYLASIGKFRRYSVGNAILIWLQLPTATRVAGYRTWQQLGRQVRRGQTAISIMAPILRRLPAEDKNEDEDGERVVAFRPAQVFNVSQTDGKPLPEFATVRGDPGIYQQRLLEFLKVRGVVVEHEQLPGSLQGMSSGGRIVVRQDLAPAQQFSVTVHEAAHELLHQGDNAEKPDKTVREVEAEAVAYVVSQAVGLECRTAACDYIKLYGGKKETLLASLASVRKAAAEIIEAVLDHDEERPNEAAIPPESVPVASAA